MLAVRECVGPNPSRARMKVFFEIARFCLAVVAVGFMFYAAQYSMSQGIQTVIASQPPAPKLMETPRFDTFEIAN